jgi:EPS-associated MarR family transcriptional regulator
MKINQDLFNVLRVVDRNSGEKQRFLAKNLGFSLGKFNYCLKELKKKGLVKIKNFKKNPSKINYIYVLTPKGLSHKTVLTLNFMKKKMHEYDELEKEYQKLKKYKNVDSNKI